MSLPIKFAALIGQNEVKRSEGKTYWLAETTRIHLFSQSLETMTSVFLFTHFYLDSIDIFVVRWFSQFKPVLIAHENIYLQKLLNEYETYSSRLHSFFFFVSTVSCSKKKDKVNRCQSRLYSSLRFLSTAVVFGDLPHLSHYKNCSI